MKKGFILYEFLCALSLGTLVLFYTSSFWTTLCGSLTRLTDSSYTFLALMHSMSFVRDTIARAPSNKALWIRTSHESSIIEWHEGAVRKKLLFKDGMLIFYVRDGKKFFSKVLAKNVVGSFELIANASLVFGVRMTISTRTSDMTAFFSCLPVVKA